MGERRDPKFNILILAPLGQDAPLAKKVLNEVDIGAEIFSNVKELCLRLKSLAAAIVITEEAIDVVGQKLLLETLQEQESWSDIPILLITSEKMRSSRTKLIIESFGNVGNISVLERPFSVISLITTVKVAIRSREKQYQNRDLIAALNAQIKSKDEFLSIASHELKTPITSLKLQFQMKLYFLNKGSSKLFKPDVLKSFFSAADQQINRLSRLVDDMLDVSRVENGKLSLTRSHCEIGDIVLSVVNTFKAVTEDSGQILNLNISDKVFGEWDKFRIEQVITNLISNAIKYGDNKPVSISVSSKEKFAVVEVQDNGPGISLEDQERLFNKFERASSTNHIQGLGLGLFICRQITDMHKGTLSVESTPGQGSTFKLHLPSKI